jgi:cell division protein FtsN
MTRDYKPAPQAKSSGKGGAFFSGLLIGLLLGIGASVALTVFIKGGENVFTDNPKSGKATLSERMQKEPFSKESALPAEENPDADKEKAPDNQFDFYTILPETESTVTEQEIKSDSTVKKDSYFLQVGAFANEADADNMKAKLALLGFEAVVQTANIPDKGTWHRVRVGPLSDVGQINKIRGELTTNGFNTDLIKVHTETPVQ